MNDRLGLWFPPRSGGWRSLIPPRKDWLGVKSAPGGGERHGVVRSRHRRRDLRSSEIVSGRVAHVSRGGDGYGRPVNPFVARKPPSGAARLLRHQRAAT